MGKKNKTNGEAGRKGDPNSGMRKEIIWIRGEDVATDGERACNFSLTLFN